jgi:hypothetical protein|tara:strand:- start:1039 stop:1218 length:180 start_codon:yes stop_codon:yes gene_type:complete
LSVVVKFYKKFINEDVIVIVEAKMKKKKETIDDEDSTLEGASKEDVKKMSKKLGYAFLI